MDGVRSVRFESLSGFYLNRRLISNNHVSEQNICLKKQKKKTEESEREVLLVGVRSLAGCPKVTEREREEDRAHQFPFLVINFRFDFYFDSLARKSYN